MRRSRHKLEVSTFPFLAVLLCAMGSLIFLLMVMDRRAKIVARHKMEAQFEELAEAKRTAQAENSAKRAVNLAQAMARRQAEWERERDNLHRMIVEQEREIRSQLAGMAHEVDSVAKTVEKKEAYAGAVKSYLTQENARLLREYQELMRKKNGSGIEDKQKTVREEMQRLTIDVLRLERTLKELRDLKSRPSDTFSLIPYRGKYGDTRRPVYVECSAAGLTLHPNRTFLSTFGLSHQRFRQEIEERAGMLDFLKKSDLQDTRGLPATNPNAYVLFLVRPDGIVNYIQAQDALDRYAIDYGYELVEPSWVFDFSNEDLAAQQPWQKGGSGALKNASRQAWSSPSVPLVGPPGSGSGPGGPGGGYPGGQGLGSPPGSPYALGQGPPNGVAGIPGSGIPGPGVPGGLGRGFTGVNPPGIGNGGPANGGSFGPGGSGSGIAVSAANGNGVPGPGGAGSGTGRGTGPGGFGPGPAGSGQGGFGPGSTTGGGGHAMAPPPPTYIFPAWLLYHPVESETKGTVAGTGPGGFGPPTAGMMASLVPSLGIASATAGPVGPPTAGVMAALLPAGLAPGKGDGFGPTGFGPGLGIGGSGDPRFGYPAGSTASGTPGSGPPGNGQPGFGSPSFRVTNPAYAQAGRPGNSANPSMSDAGNPVFVQGDGVQGDPAQPARGGNGPAGPAPPGTWQRGSGEPSNGVGGTPGSGGSSGTGPGGASGNPSAPGGDPAAQASGEQRPSGPPGKTPPGQSDPVNAGQPGLGSWASQGLGSSSTDRGPTPKAPPTPSKLRENHDFLINIVCWPDGVVLTTTGELYPMNPAESQEQVRAALVQKVQQMVVRRQATVREGEPAYQPMIRLQVKPEGGLRSLFWIGPALNALRIPMTRENLIN